MSCVHIYYGNGKGKTSAALGLVIRAAGAGMNACVIRFLKSSLSSEVRSLIKIGVEEKNAGLEGFLKDMHGEKREHAIEQQRKLLLQICPQKYDILVLDEILDAVDMGIVARAELEVLIQNRGECEIVLTGRKAWPELEKKADYITEMVLHRHPYNSRGAGPRKGIEY